MATSHRCPSWCSSNSGLCETAWFRSTYWLWSRKMTKISILYWYWFWNSQRMHFDIGFVSKYWVDRYWLVLILISNFSMLVFCTNLGPTFWRAYVVKYWFQNRYWFEILAKISWFWYWYWNRYWNGSNCNFVFGIGFEIQLPHYWYRYWFWNKCLPDRIIGIESKWTVLHSPE